MRRKIVPLLLLILISASALGEVRPTLEELVSLRSASAPQISPDGTSIAWVLTTRKRDATAKPSDDDRSGGWKTERQLYVASATGGTPRQLTYAKESPSSPQWLPDGSAIAFLRNHKIHVLAMEGGEARAIETGAFEPQGFAYSPDGKSIAFTATAVLTAEEKDVKWRSGGAKVFEGEWRNADLFVVDASGGEPRRVTNGKEHVTAFAWSPDGRRFALLVAESADPYFAFSLMVPKVIATADGALVRQLDPQARAVGSIRWSPDGKRVAWEKADQTLSLLNFLAVHDLESAQTWNAAAKLDPTLAGFVWSTDSRSIVIHVYEKTTSRFYRVAADGSSAKPIPFDGRVVRSSLAHDRARQILAFHSATPMSPANVTTFDVTSGATRVVTDLNPEVSGWTLGNAEVVRWKSPEGAELEGVLTVTPDAKPGVPPPLMVMPHGGPDSVTSNDFSAWAHYFAANGFSVFRPNYRGGLAYGRELYAANRGRLGVIEMMDIESGVDALIRAGKADPKRLVYGGWSWGGYLTTWTIGHTNRYRAAVVGAGVTDTVLQYATSDINHGAAAQWEFQGNPWLQPERFARANPLHSLAKVRTPTLIIHGENDERVPLPNAIVLYRALKDADTPVRLLTYPDEPHGFTNSAHTMHMLTEWLAWYRKYVP
ncbi:MAG TPA: S9 family peptidase [Thermoanaerobaculia bacterium]|jgi:dipeptidyl aminopeptidase/acylaminoacyl peptidase|nr:S9 family peptidase [Thermoanaerobaculia bacterium]